VGAFPLDALANAVSLEKLSATEGRAAARVGARAGGTVDQSNDRQTRQGEGGNQHPQKQIALHAKRNTRDPARPCKAPPHWKNV
jgi:hypothetical protein